MRIFGFYDCWREAPQACHGQLTHYKVMFRIQPHKYMVWVLLVGMTGDHIKVGKGKPEDVPETPRAQVEVGTIKTSLFAGER